MQRRSTQDDRWGDDLTGMEIFAPSRANDETYRRWLSREMRRSVSPASAAALIDVLALSDVRDVLPTVRVPTLVVHRADNRWLTADHGRYLAEHIPGARYVEVPGNDHVPYLGDTDSILGEIEEFLTGTRLEPHADRILATLLFTDIVGSTEHASRLGDRAWHDLLERHDTLVRTELKRQRGHEVKTTGDGFLITFDGPARAIHCAISIRDSLPKLGLELRAGLHTGECEMHGNDIGGIAVHIAQRVQAQAAPNEILVSSTVRDLVTGSGIRFSDHGEHQLKGVSGARHLFRVESA